MYRQNHQPFVRAAVMIATGVASSIATLWSWNTLAELLGGPQAQFKHLAAAAIILALLRWATITSPALHRQPRSPAEARGKEQPAHD